MVGAHVGKVETIIELLEAGADPNAADKEQGATPLIMASQAGHVQL